jgi:hypothetical protein
VRRSELKPAKGFGPQGDLPRDAALAGLALEA